MRMQSLGFLTQKKEGTLPGTFFYQLQLLCP